MTDRGDLTWTGARLAEGSAWQGIRYLQIAFPSGGGAVVTVFLNRPAGTLTTDQVVVTGGRRVPVPPHYTTVGGGTVTITFASTGDHSPYTVTLLDGGGDALHPFFASAQFRFSIDCDAGDCREPAVRTRPPAAQPPAVDLLTKDFTGFVGLLSDRVRVHNPAVADLSDASVERVLLDLLAWSGDMISYHQDRVAGEAFVDTARQRFSLRQHAVLLGTGIDDGRAPTTVLAVDPDATGFVPAGLQVRVRTAPDEVPVSFVVADRTRVQPANATRALRPAAFPGAADAEVPAGATRLLLWGHGPELRAGDRLALVQSPFAQVVTLTAVRRTEAAGWVASPADGFDPATDGPAAVTAVEWAEPLTGALLPWADPPLSLYGNLVDARFGAPRRAVLSAPPGRGEVGVTLTGRSAVLARRVVDGPLLLRALRVPEWPVAHDGPDGPAVGVTIGGEAWTLRPHLQRSRSYDLHFTAQTDEDGAVWLGFGDGVHGHEVDPQKPVRIDYRLGDAVAGNVGLGTVVDVVRPSEGTVAAELDDLGGVAVTNVLPATGGRGPATLDRIREEIPASLRHGPLERAVALEDYARAAMDVPGVARATARLTGGVFNTVTVLVDPAGSPDLDPVLRQRVQDHVDDLRMTGREHVVLAAEYVPLEVELVLCARPGSAPHLVRDRVLVRLRPGSADRPGWFHPDRLGFGDTVRLGDFVAVVADVPGVRSVTATVFRPRGDARPVHDVITLDRTKVARLDADPDYPENGTLRVGVAGLDADPAALVVDGAGVP